MSYKLWELTSWYFWRWTVLHDALRWPWPHRHCGDDLCRFSAIGRARTEALLAGDFEAWDRLEPR